MMADLTANPLPEGEKCGTCRFAGTHTHATDAKAKVLVRCLRYPPQRRGTTVEPAPLVSANRDTIWPVLTWDDWCGEFRYRAAPSAVDMRS